MKVTTVGIDLAKNVLQLHGVKQYGKTLIKKQIRRDQMAEFLIDKFTYENAVLKRLKLGPKSEKMSAEQRSLLDETLDADLAAVADEIAQTLPE